MMARAVPYMLASFFVSALISEADALSGLFLLFVHVLDRWRDATRCCKGYSWRQHKHREKRQEGNGGGSRREERRERKKEKR
jgi:hypothetical protein